MPNNKLAFIKKFEEIHPIFIGFFSACIFMVTMLILTDRVTMFAVSQAIMASFFATNTVHYLFYRVWLSAAIMGLATIASCTALVLIMSGQI